MKLSNLRLVNELVATRGKLLIQRDDSGIDILIRGELQHCDFVDVVVPAIKLEIGRRIADIEARLLKLGVEIDTIRA